MKVASLGFVLPATQTPPIQFEVASVKINESGPFAIQRVNVQAGDRVTITNVTARTLIQVAYKLSPQQVEGGPRWLDSERFDIVAKAEQRASTDDLLRMLHHLLADRFRLKSHLEDRTAPGYVPAFEEQLGLKLASERTVGAALVIEAIERPTPD
jgi:hypothetical protein